MDILVINFNSIIILYNKKSYFLLSEITT